MLITSNAFRLSTVEPVFNRWCYEFHFAKYAMFSFFYYLFQILPRNHVIKCLETISNCNWHGVKNGDLGAINGCFPGSKLDVSNVQAEEFWVGVNYSLASLMIAEGMIDEGFAIAEKCYNTVYNLYGLHFQTPEAYMTDGRFRCPGYMRPLAIWSIQDYRDCVNV
ncbi:unnamed protein product [Trichobilharzia regenti]|nr:unnamed protein product [Trichobilharzia regenti]